MQLLVRALLVAAAVAGGLLAGCGGRAVEAPPPATPAAAAPGSAVAAPAPPVHGCSEAAAGFESGTRGIRAPESSMLQTIRARCLADAWPAAAIDCFAMMTEGDLGRCAGELPVHSRDRMFAALGSGGHDHEGAGDALSSELSLAISVAKLQLLRVGIPGCDAFIATVRHALSCVAMPVEMRVQLGAETADFWSLPSSGLPASAQQKMAQVCGKSLAVLEEEVLEAGCMP